MWNDGDLFGGQTASVCDASSQVIGRTGDRVRAADRESLQLPDDVEVEITLLSGEGRLQQEVWSVATHGNGRTSTAKQVHETLGVDLRELDDIGRTFPIDGCHRSRDAVTVNEMARCPEIWTGHRDPARPPGLGDGLETVHNNSIGLDLHPRSASG
jgi:hypothetical protein